MINWANILKMVDVVVGEILFNNVVEKSVAVKAAN